VAFLASLFTGKRASAIDERIYFWLSFLLYFYACFLKKIPPTRGGLIFARPGRAEKKANRGASNPVLALRRKTSPLGHPISAPFLPKTA